MSVFVLFVRAPPRGGDEGSGACDDGDDYAHGQGLIKYDYKI